jgi:hypothetical protein
MNDLLKISNDFTLVATYKLIKMKLIFFKNYAAASDVYFRVFFRMMAISQAAGLTPWRRAHQCTAPGQRRRRPVINSAAAGRPFHKKVFILGFAYIINVL